jgi:probable rRNA maturation factor
VSAPVAAIVISAPCPGWSGACPNAETIVDRSARSALANGVGDRGPPSRAALEIGICLTNDAAQQRLNRDWRGIDRVTNVLAFPAWDPGAPVPPDAPLLLGDVVLAFETVAREAVEQKKPLAHHLAHLVVHGVLHLLGYDHVSEGDAAAMEFLETTILAELGVPDPYRDPMSATGAEPVFR